MWLFTNFGFFSVVKKDESNDLTVRSRTKSDLSPVRSDSVAHEPVTQKFGHPHFHRPKH